MKTPFISILICTYNAEKFISETMGSVLAQTYRDFELLILDNGSKDGTKEIIQKLKSQTLNSIQIINAKSQMPNTSPQPPISTFFLPKNIGSYTGLNYLLDKAKGKYIAINDHDDIWHKDKLQKQIELLEKHDEYVGCGSAIINWYEKYDTYLYRSQPERSDVAWHSSLVFRNNGYRYDLRQKVATDFYFIKNIISQNKQRIYNFQEPFVLRRIYKDSKNLSGLWMKKVSFLEIIKMNIKLFDKLALLNRRIVPQEWVEWVLNQLFAGKVPSKYTRYLSDLNKGVDLHTF